MKKILLMSLVLFSVPCVQTAGGSSGWPLGHYEECTECGQKLWGQAHKQLHMDDTQHMVPHSKRSKKVPVGQRAAALLKQLGHSPSQDAGRKSTSKMKSKSKIVRPKGPIDASAAKRKKGKAKAKSQEGLLDEAFEEGRKLYHSAADYAQSLIDDARRSLEKGKKSHSSVSPIDSTLGSSIASSASGSRPVSSASKDPIELDDGIDWDAFMQDELQRSVAGDFDPVAALDEAQMGQFGDLLSGEGPDLAVHYCPYCAGSEMTESQYQKHMAEYHNEAM